MNKLLVTIGAILTMTLVPIQAKSIDVTAGLRMRDITVNSVRGYFQRSARRLKISKAAIANIRESSIAGSTIMYKSFLNMKIPKEKAKVMALKVGLVFIIVAVAEYERMLDGRDRASTELGFTKNFNHVVNPRLVQTTMALFNALVAKELEYRKENK